MIEIKDIAGLKEPLKRLIEVTAEGVGGLSRPFLTRKNADAKAYEVRVIAEAIAESQKLLGPVTYSAGDVVIESGQHEDSLQLPEADLDKRVISRMAYQESKRQSNIEKITQYAAEDLDDTEEVGSERPDSDWTTRFFRIAEDITTDEMQALWGKVLAGEVKRVGSFSLRTLDILKNISKKEAEAFVRVARIAITSGDGDKAFLLTYNHAKITEEQFGIHFVDLLLLREIGLLTPNELGLLTSPSKEDVKLAYSCGSTCIFIRKPADKPEHKIDVVAFTEIGKQLLQLVDREPADTKYIEKFASSFQAAGMAVKSGEITHWKNDNSFEHKNLNDVPGNIPKAEQAKKPNE